MAKKKEIVIGEFITPEALRTIKDYYMRFEVEKRRITEEEELYLKILLVLAKCLSRAKDFIDKYAQIRQADWNIKDVVEAVYGKDKATVIRGLLAPKIRRTNVKRTGKKVVDKKHKGPNKDS